MKDLYLIFLIPFLSLLTVTGYSQNGVKITDGSDKSINPNIILQVESSTDNKGLLYPRTSFDLMLKINNPKDGLLVYVIDQDVNKNGLWFYNSYEKEWMRYQTVPSPSKYPEPIGSIIIYTGSLNNFYGYDGAAISGIACDKGLGKLGTDMEGWAICNGKNGTPNMMGRFFMGGYNVNEETSVKSINDYLNYPPANEADLNTFKSSGKTGGIDEYKLTVDQLPAHSHDTKQENIKHTTLNHSHTVHNWGPHDHSYPEGKTNKRSRPHGDYENKIDDRDAGYPVTSGSMEFAAELQAPTNPADMNFKVTFNPLTDGSLISYTGQANPAPIENRPAHYSVIYLIKVDKGIYQRTTPLIISDQDLQKPIKY